MASIKTRSKFGYLTYNRMLEKIKSGEIDAYDIVFTSDSKECYIVSPELKPIGVKSKVYIFNDKLEAEETLNKNNDTYSGQIVSILSGEKYKAYIVNQKDELFYVEPICELIDVDYDTLGNRPIINMVGTLDNSITVSNLNTGIYKIVGQYKITDTDETIYLAASDVIFLVNKENNSTKIRRITSDEIVNYSITNGISTSSHLITEEYLKENNYVQESYINTKISALEKSLKEELTNYITSTLDGQLSQIIDEKIDQKIDEKLDEKLTETDNSQITSLFN